MQRVKSDFNRSRNERLEKQLNAYNIRGNARAEVWQVVREAYKERDAKLEQEKKDFNNLKIWEERFKKEYNLLKAEYEVNANLVLAPPGSDRGKTLDLKLRQRASTNVEQKYLQAMRAHHKTAEQKIQKKIDQTRELAQDKTLSQDFQRAHDHSRDR